MPRNTRACARCADMRKKCNMDPPYSLSMCEGCTRDGVHECPPHRPRRNRRQENQAVPTTNPEIPQEATVFMPDSQVQYAPETSNDNTIEPTNATDSEAQSSYQIGSAGLHSADTVQQDATSIKGDQTQGMHSQAALPVANPFDGLYGNSHHNVHFPWFFDLESMGVWSGASSAHEWQIPGQALDYV